MKWDFLYLLLSAVLVLTACWDEEGSQSNTLPYPITAVAVDPVNPNVVYLATRGNGIYKSEDSGVNWRRVIAGLLDLMVDDLAVDLYDPETVYAATEGGIYRGIDVDLDEPGVESWERIEGSGTGITAIVIDRNSCNTKGLPCRNVYTASESEGIHKSTDSGLSWGPMNVGLTETAVKSLGISPPLYLPGTFPDQCPDPPKPCLDISDIDP